jgi:hypothetical protein
MKNIKISFGRFSYEFYPHGLVKIEDPKEDDTYYIHLKDFEQLIIDFKNKKLEEQRAKLC